MHRRGHPPSILWISDVVMLVASSPIEWSWRIVEVRYDFPDDSAKALRAVSRVLHCAQSAVWLHHTVLSPHRIAVASLPLALNVASVRVLHWVVERVLRVVRLRSSKKIRDWDTAMWKYYRCQWSRKKKVFVVAGWVEVRSHWDIL
jgi:hypothetical protein